MGTRETGAVLAIAAALGSEACQDKAAPEKAYAYNSEQTLLAAQREENKEKKQQYISDTIALQKELITPAQAEEILQNFDLWKMNKSTSTILLPVIRTLPVERMKKFFQENIDGQSAVIELYRRIVTECNRRQGILAEAQMAKTEEERSATEEDLINDYRANALRWEEDKEKVGQILIR